jgi:hypothetical protein
MVQDPQERDVLWQDRMSKPRLSVDEEAPEVLLWAYLLVVSKPEVEGADQREVLSPVDATDRDDVRGDPQGAIEEKAHALKRADRVGVGPSMSQDEQAVSACAFGGGSEDLVQVSEGGAQELRLCRVRGRILLRHELVSPML